MASPLTTLFILTCSVFLLEPSLSLESCKAKLCAQNCDETRCNLGCDSAVKNCTQNSNGTSFADMTCAANYCRQNCDEVSFCDVTCSSGVETCIQSANASSFTDMICNASSCHQTCEGSSCDQRCGSDSKTCTQTSKPSHGKIICDAEVCNQDCSGSFCTLICSSKVKECNQRCSGSFCKYRCNATNCTIDCTSGFCTRLTSPSNGVTTRPSGEVDCWFCYSKTGWRCEQITNKGSKPECTVRLCGKSWYDSMAEKCKGDCYQDTKCIRQPYVPTTNSTSTSVASMRMLVVTMVLALYQ